MKPNEFAQVLGKVRASAILRTADASRARHAMEAAVRGGFRVCEFTLTTPGALALIREFAAMPDLLVGAGTVLTREQARRAVGEGAVFLVSPVVDEEVIEEATRLGVTMIPGCATPTEMLRAHRAGAPFQKLFPAPATGPAWVAQTLAPLPFLRIVPTSGVTLENAASYLRAGAFAVGFVNSLFAPDDIAADRWNVIEDRSRRMLDEVMGAAGEQRQTPPRRG